MKRNLFTAVYFVAHLVTALAWMALLTVVPFVLTIVWAITAGDLGGPLFWPLFLILLMAGGLFSAVILSLATLMVDLLRQRWSFPLWIPSLVLVGIFLCLEFALVGFTQWALLRGVLFGALAALLFSAYWVSVTSLWFLPRFLARSFNILAQATETSRGWWGGSKGNDS